MPLVEFNMQMELLSDSQRDHAKWCINHWKTKHSDKEQELADLDEAFVKSLQTIKAMTQDAKSLKAENKALKAQIKAIKAFIRTA
jgi:predicted RNase H-like nuclease (RuvC/YqgF family)